MWAWIIVSFILILGGMYLQLVSIEKAMKTYQDVINGTQARILLEIATLPLVIGGIILGMVIGSGM